MPDKKHSPLRLRDSCNGDFLCMADDIPQKEKAEDDWNISLQCGHGYSNQCKTEVIQKENYATQDECSHNGLRELLSDDVGKKESVQSPKKRVNNGQQKAEKKVQKTDKKHTK